MIKKQRLIALFDILGFGSRLKSEPLPDLRRQLRTLIRSIRSEAVTNTATNMPSEDDDNLESARFVFDSVVLVSLPLDDPRNAEKFIYACIRMLEIGFVHRLPFRGSITIGDLFTDEETGLLLGDHFPELRDAEQMQDWVGCFIHSEAVDAVFTGLGSDSKDRLLSEPTASHAVNWFEVPVKESFKKFAPLKAWCLNWVQMLDADAIPIGLDYLKADPAKHEQTKRFVDYVCSLPRRLQPIRGNGVPEGTMMKTIQSKGVFRAQSIDAHGNTLRLSGTLQYTILNEGDDMSSEQGTYKLPPTDNDIRF